MRRSILADCPDWWHSTFPEHGQCGLKSPNQGFEFLSGTDHLGDFGDGIVVEVHGWELPFPPIRFQVLMSDGAT